MNISNKNKVSKKNRIIDQDKHEKMIKVKNGFSYEKNGWKYINITGEPKERGFAYGYLCAKEFKEIQEMLEIQSSHIKCLIKNNAPKKFIAQAKEMYVYYSKLKAKKYKQKYIIDDTRTPTK